MFDRSLSRRITAQSVYIIIKQQHIVSKFKFQSYIYIYVRTCNFKGDSTREETPAERGGSVSWSRWF